MDNRLHRIALPVSLALLSTTWAIGQTSRADGSSAQARGQLETSAGSESARRAVLIALGSIDSDRAAAEAVAQTIQGLGVDAVRPLIEVLVQGRFAEPIGEFGDVTRRVQRAHIAAITQSLELLPWGSVRAVIAERTSPAEPLRSRLILGRLLAEIAPAADLAMLGVAITGDGSAIPRDSHRTFAGSLGRWLRRDARASAYFPRLVATLHPSLIRISVEALRTHAPHAAMDALSGSLGVDPRFDQVLLMEIADASKTARRPAEPGVLAKIRPFADHRQPTCALEAVSALGRLDDVESIEALVGHMKSDSPAMRARAQEALEKVADERLGSDASAWSNWFAAATNWYENKYPDVSFQLKSGPVSQRSQALLQFARHRVFRHHLDGAVIDSLGDADESVVLIACAVLGHFATESSLNALVASLDAESVAVRKAALDALHRATGERHGELRSDWVSAGWGLATENDPSESSK